MELQTTLAPAARAASPAYAAGERAGGGARERTGGAPGRAQRPRRSCTSTGGGYCSARSRRTARSSAASPRETGVRVLSVGLPAAPRASRHPAAVEDAVAAYRFGSAGRSRPRQVAFAGDPAGAASGGRPRGGARRRASRCLAASAAFRRGSNLTLSGDSMAVGRRPTNPMPHARGPASCSAGATRAANRVPADRLAAVRGSRGPARRSSCRWAPTEVLLRRLDAPRRGARAARVEVSLRRLGDMNPRLARLRDWLPRRRPGGAPARAAFVGGAPGYAVQEAPETRSPAPALDRVCA